MYTEDLKSLVGQTFLQSGGYYTGGLDGSWGPLSITAADRWVSAERQAIAAMVPPADRATILEGRANIGFLRTLAAQIYLKKLGPYTGAIDGVWGPLSKSAANAWAAVHFPPAPLDTATGILTPYAVAARYLGVREIPGKKHNGTILNWLRRLQISIFDDETPWCSTFVNFCALEAGYERTGKLNARSWLDIGQTLTTQDCREGDVIIFERGTSGWEGHVTFLVSYDRRRGTMICLGGNQSDEVNLATYSTSKLLGIRRLRSLDQLQGGSNKI
jgi:uncharacterized protein (TIGR02594 family)